MAGLKLAVSLIVMVLMDITVLNDVLTQLRVPDSQCIKGESYPHIFIPSLPTHYIIHIHANGPLRTALH